MDNLFDLPPPFVSEGITKIVLGENIKGGLFTAEQLRAAVEAEREACAKLCEDRAGAASMFATVAEARSHGATVRGCAAAIRARGKS